MAPRAADTLVGLLSLSNTTIESPFPELDVELSGVSLRETAYEILVAASGITALSARTKPVKTKVTMTSTASRLKKAILRPMIDKGKSNSLRGSKSLTLGETVRYQMEISEQSDDRIRRALIKAAAAQVNKPVEAMLIPLELLLNITPLQFTDQSEYEQWRLRQLRVLEAGLVLHPANVHDGEDATLSDRLQQMLVDLAGNSLETGAKNEAWLSLRIAAMAKAGKTQNGESPRAGIHWADGYPMNVHLYECLLSSCFDTLDEVVLIDEFDEVLEWIKKTWGILGVNRMLHCLCFMWVLFSQFIKTGENEAELLIATEEQMKEAAAELKVTLSEDYSNSFRSALSTIQAWAEIRLMQYRELYPQGAQGTMAALVTLELTASRILAEDRQRVSPRKKKSLENFESNRVDKYIRSSMRTAVMKMIGTSDAQRKAPKAGEKPRPALEVLAQDIGVLARDERLKYSPVLQQWHVTPAGVAAAALHSCFGKELQQYISGITGISPDLVQVLQAADQLEMDLVQIAVEDAVDAEDGGKSLIREMPLYEAQSIMDTMSKKWIEEGVGRLAQWADRNVQNEQWNPRATREGYAPSAVEVLRIIEETMDLFFYLPISKDPQYVKFVVAGVEQSIRRYCQATLAGCGKKERYVPSLPGLTRYNKKAFSSKGGWRSLLQVQKSKLSSSNSGLSSHSSELSHICVRINTLNYMSTELQYLEKRLRYGWLKEGPSKTVATGSSSPTNIGVDSDNFKELRGELEGGVQLLIELASYRVIFHDLHRVFWEGLYAGGVENARISQVIEQVDPQLGIIAEIASEQLRNRIVAALMKACLDCLVLVLLAGGPSRAFRVSDAEILEDDLTLLKDLFKADGEGLPDDLVEKAAAPIQKVLRLFHISSEKLIETLRASCPEAEGSGSGRFSSKAAPIPRTTGDWSPEDSNTILRVLCYRGDDTASQYLKKIFNLPKKLPSTQ